MKTARIENRMLEKIDATIARTEDRILEKIGGGGILKYAPKR